MVVHHIEYFLRQETGSEAIMSSFSKACLRFVGHKNEKQDFSKGCIHVAVKWPEVESWDGQLRKIRGQLIPGGRGDGALLELTDKLRILYVRSLRIRKFAIP